MYTLTDEIRQFIGKLKKGDIPAEELVELYRWYNRQAREPIELDEIEMQCRLERIRQKLPKTD